MNSVLVYGTLLSCCLTVFGNIHLFKNGWNHFDAKYSTFPEWKRLEKLEEAKQMFHFGYDNYMKHAFPMDELDPIHCCGRGPDYDNPSNININDVLGDYALTLVDALDTLAIMGNCTEFKKAVNLVLETISFDKSNTVQVFEANIRVLGALISAHLIATDPNQPFGSMTPDGYNDDLLHLAHDLAVRLLPAFDNTATGIPYARINLKDGVPPNCLNETCTSGAGTLLLEFGLLSRLLDDPIYEGSARNAINTLWRFRSNVTGLFGNVINIQTGRWSGLMSGLGAGLDSFYEYLLKAYILFGHDEDLQRFNESYETIKYYMRRGRKHCNSGTGFPPIYVNVNMRSGEIINNWIDALQAAWPGIQVLNGDIEEAICMHTFYYAIWQRYGALPERYNWNMRVPEVLFYPLRPELVESTYLLYQATKNPFYLHVGSEIMASLNNHTKAECGYATIHDINKKDLEDRMESFFLSETCKYLYLLFDTENHVNVESSKYLFSTEGHLFPIRPEFRSSSESGETSKRAPPKTHHSHPPLDKRKENLSDSDEDEMAICQPEENPFTPGMRYEFLDSPTFNSSRKCDRIPMERSYFLPIENRYFQQVLSLVGLE